MNVRLRSIALKHHESFNVSVTLFSVIITIYNKKHISMPQPGSHISHLLCMYCYTQLVKGHRHSGYVFFPSFFFVNLSLIYVKLVHSFH